MDRYEVHHRSDNHPGTREEVTKRKTDRDGIESEDGKDRTYRRIEYRDKSESEGRPCR